jgi:uncharacterized protein
MSTSPVSTKEKPVRSARTGGVERLLFSAAVAVVVVHIADDELVQRQPGTSAGDHWPAVLVPVGVALVAAFAYRRLRPGLRAAISLAFGILTVVSGMISLGGARAEGPSGSEWTGLLLLPAGAALLGLGVWVPWRERGRWAKTTRRRWLNRGIAVVGAAVALFYFVIPVGASLWTTHKFRTEIGTFTIPHQDVTFRTGDGLLLSGWYVPSRNRAAVVIVHGGGGGRAGGGAGWY